jgi:hypothetical protein
MHTNLEPGKTLTNHDDTERRRPQKCFAHVDGNFLVNMFGFPLLSNSTRSCLSIERWLLLGTIGVMA